jgi:hypothetical protein
MQLPKPGFETKILEVLRKGPIKASVLIDFVKKASGKATIQGIYKALRSLKQEGIVLVQKKEVFLNQVWLEQVERFTTLTKHAYRYPISDSGHFLQMKDGDKIMYKFKDPIQVDIFWNHVLYILFDAVPNIDRWYAYASHCWFLIARREDELMLKEYMRKRNILYLFTVGHKTPLDQSIKSDFDGKSAKYHMLETPIFSQRKNSQGIVLNVVGDYILEAQYDKKTTNLIEGFYKTHSKMTPENLKDLQDIVSKPSEIRFLELMAN